MAAVALTILAFLSVVMVAYILEIVLFLAGSRWYYGIGPALHREEWQSSVTSQQAADAISRGLHPCELRSYLWTDRVGFRRPWWHFGAYPRAVLKVQEGPRGAILVCEIRPFISMAVLAIVIFLLLLVPAFRNIVVYGFLAFTEIYIMACYLGCWRRERRILVRLGGLRASLRDIGVQICDKCSYDLHGRDRHQPCPECGHVAESLMAPPVATSMHSPNADRPEKIRRQA